MCGMEKGNRWEVMRRVLSWESRWAGLGYVCFAYNIDFLTSSLKIRVCSICFALSVMLDMWQCPGLVGAAR